MIDQKVKEHLGAFRPPVAAYVRPGMPVLPTPMMGQMPPGGPFRPPMMPRPMPGAPGMQISTNILWFFLLMIRLFCMPVSCLLCHCLLDHH